MWVVLKRDELAETCLKFATLQTIFMSPQDARTQIEQLLAGKRNSNLNNRTCVVLCVADRERERERFTEEKLVCERDRTCLVALVGLKTTFFCNF